MNDKEKLIVEYTEYLQSQIDEHENITYTQLNGIIDIIEGKFIPHDCEKSNGQCLSKIGHMCKYYKDGLCKYH